MIQLKLTIITAVFILVENNYQLGANAFDADAFHRRFQKDENIQKSHEKINNKEENHTPASYPNGIHKRYDTVQNMEHYVNDDATKNVPKRNVLDFRTPTTESTPWQNSEYFKNNYQNNQFKYNYENNGMIHHNEKSSFYTSPPSLLYLPSAFLEVPVIPAEVPPSVVNRDKPPKLDISTDSKTDIKTTSVHHKNNSESMNTKWNYNIQSVGGSTVEVMNANQMPNMKDNGSASERKEGSQVSLWQNSTGSYTVETFENGSQIIMIVPKINTTNDQQATVLSIGNNANNAPEMKVTDLITEGQAGSGVRIWKNSTGTYTIESFGNGSQVIMLLGETETKNSEGNCKEHHHNTHDYVVHHYHHIIHHHHEPDFPHIEYYHQPNYPDCCKHNPTSGTTKPCISNSEQNQHLCKHDFHDHQNYPYYPSYPRFPSYPHYPTVDPHYHDYLYGSPISFIYHR